MFNYQLSFGAPWYLLLLVLLPLLWWFSFRGLAGLGRVRRWVVLSIRTVVLLLLIAALAEIQMVRISDRLTVVYLLDQSLSIPPRRRAAMIEYVNKAIQEHRKDRDRVGVIVFGRDAAIKIPPFDDDVQLAPAIESALDQDHTNLAGAMKLAQASFPEDAAKRIIVISDGNQNLGDAMEQARGVAAAGIGIDALPVRYHSRAEVIVERLAIPSDIRRGQPFDLRVVVTNTAQPTAGDSGEVRGRLVLSQLTGDRPTVLSDQQVVLPPGKKVFSIRQEIDAANFYTYEARYVPDPGRPDDDAMRQNNRATAFTHVRGKGQILLIEDYEHPGEFDFLVQRLRDQGLEVTVEKSNATFTSLGELQVYDTIVLANVACSTNQDVYFTNDRIAMLVRNTQEMGAGLVMLGGPNSFGAGGWTGTELEKAMPVDFQIKSAKVVPRGALLMVIDKSGSMAGKKIELSKAAAIEAARVLGPHDFVGVVAFDEAAYTVVPVQRAGDTHVLARRVQRLAGSGGTNMLPGMNAGYRELKGLDAAIKHMIVLTDGRTTGSGYPALAARMRRENMTVSCVAVGDDADTLLMHNIAIAGGGKYYRVRNPKALPRIFQREARRVSRSLIYEQPVRPVTKFPHEMLGGIEGPLPPIDGFVLTSKKDNPLVEVSLVSPKPAGERNSTILASWTYGLGKAVAFTSDAGARWASDWTAEPDKYDRLFVGMIRWSMRPTGESGRFTTTVDVEDEEVRVVVTALDKDDEFLNFLSMTGRAVGPDLESVPIKIEQTAPGRYVGKFPARKAGSYFVIVDPGSAPDEKTRKLQKLPPIRTGVNVPYSDEFRDRTPNEALLGELARLVPTGGTAAGLIIQAPADSQKIEPLLAVNPFRHEGLPKATSSQDIWFYVALICSCLFFFDVFFRRVQVSFAWVGPALGRVFGRGAKPAEDQTLQRLRSRKAEVSTRIEQLRSDARFEPAEMPPDAEIVEEPLPQRPSAPTVATEEETEEESYTERLLRAKKKAWDKREK